MCLFLCLVPQHTLPGCRGLSSTRGSLAALRLNTAAGGTWCPILHLPPLCPLLPRVPRLWQGHLGWTASPSHPDLSTAEHRGREKAAMALQQMQQVRSWMVQLRNQIMCVCGHPWSGSSSPCLSPLDSNLGSSCWIRISGK